MNIGLPESSLEVSFSPLFALVWHYPYPFIAIRTQILWKLNEGEGKFLYDQSEPHLPHANGEIVGDSFAWKQATDVSYIPSVSADEVPTTESDVPVDRDFSPVNSFDAATTLLQAVSDICSTHTELKDCLDVQWSFSSWIQVSARSTCMLISILEALIKDTSTGKDCNSDVKTKAISNVLRIFDTHVSQLTIGPSMTATVKERAGNILRQFVKPSSDSGSLATLQSQALELIFCKSMISIVCPEPKDRLESLMYLVRQDTESYARAFLRKLISR